VKYVRAPGFLIDLRRLPDAHRKLFVEPVHELLRPALDAGAHTGTVPWPRALRIHRIGRLLDDMEFPGTGRPGLVPAGGSRRRNKETRGSPSAICAPPSKAQSLAPAPLVRDQD
jgi:hypothetical protein